MIILSLLHPIQATPVQSWSFPVEPLVRIGRASDNDVVVYSAVVSRHHVEMRLTPEGWWEITSLGANGTYVNQERITKTKATDGMVMRLGSTGPKIQISLDPLAVHVFSKTMTPRKTATDQPDPSARIKTFLTEPKTATNPTDAASEEDDDTTQFPV